jgi:hypothetical protein
MDPVEAKGLSGVLLVDKRDRLAVDNTVVALDDQVLASTTADEFRSVVSEPELCSERMAVVLPSGPAGTSGQSRLEDVRRMRPPRGRYHWSPNRARSSFGWYPASIDRL